MTPRERLLAVLHGEMPDCVPCCPDISNMVPCRLTGKPFWDIYAFNNPPLWKAHIDALTNSESEWEERVVKRFPDGRFATLRYSARADRWQTGLVVYTADNPPATGVKPEVLGLPAAPTEWEKMPTPVNKPPAYGWWHTAREYLGDRGIIGIPSGISTCLVTTPEQVYAYYEDPEPFRERVQTSLEYLEERMQRIAAMNPRPDFLFCGYSGTLIWQTPAMFRELGLPLLKRATELASDLGIPTHVHSCGPERELVRMAAEETKLTIIDPLEIPPMGDCDLAELKKRYGDKIVLKGNLHTTDVMLRGSVDDVVRASKKAIDDAGADGGFILSTGDQCGRDTPDDNIRAMVEVARTYGRY